MFAFLLRFILPRFIYLLLTFVLIMRDLVRAIRSGDTEAVLLVLVSASLMVVQSLRSLRLLFTALVAAWPVRREAPGCARRQPEVATWWVRRKVAGSTRLRPKLAPWARL
jgi:hypothetical protein